MYMYVMVIVWLLSQYFCDEEELYLGAQFF